VRNFNLMARLRDVQLCLLSPPNGVPDDEFQFCSYQAHRSRDHRRLAAQAYALRQAFNNTSTVSGVGSPAEDRDSLSWQILAVAHEKVVGAVRLRVYHSQYGVPSAEDLFNYFEVSISNSDTRRLIRDAVDAYAQRQFARCGRFWLGGGLAVCAERQRSALSPVLTLSVHALFEALGLHGGCTMGPENSGALNLYQRLGGFPLTSSGFDLPAFACTKHGHNARILAVEPDRYEPHLAATVAALHHWIRHTRVIAPEPEKAIAC
jgi:hypothetical protein